MNILTQETASRWRRHHRVAFFTPLLILGLGFVLHWAGVLEPMQPFVGAALLGTFALSLLWAPLVQIALLRRVDPSDDVRREVLSLSSWSPFGSFWAVNELLRVASQESPRPN